MRQCDGRNRNNDHLGPQELHPADRRAAFSTLWLSWWSTKAPDQGSQDSPLHVSDGKTMDMIETARELVHPGVYVRQHVIPQGMTVTKAATLLGIGRPALSNFLNGRASLSQGMARRLERAFGADREHLLDLQTQYDGRDEAVRTHVVSGRHAPTLVEIKARRIEDWADTARAREDLPALLRRLVYTTHENATRIDFPAFDNAQRHGWDGEVEATAPTPWIPDGRSLWEFGCEKPPLRKANEDYGKRASKVPHGERRDATFVFVTPRNWPRKQEWAAEKATLADWKDVRAYDASDLEQWLEQSAPTQVWLAERLGYQVGGFRSPDRCWSDWSDVCEPPLSSALFSEPKDSSAKFRNWLDTPPSRPFIVAADSIGEALAFACHLVNRVQTAEDQPGASALVFDAPEALRRFRAASASPHIAIVGDAEVEQEIGDLYRHCHCVVVRPANDAEGEPDIRLGLPDWRQFSDALEEMGISADRIEQLARESGRSPAVLRRRLASLPAIRGPAWEGNASVARKLIPSVLVGAWCQASPSDCELVRQLARSDDDFDVENAVMELFALPDPPLWTAGEYRGVVSRIDTLFGVAKFVTGPDLDTFFSVAERVLSEPDPALDLPEEERWAAAAHNKIRAHSPALRRGIRETLVLLSVHGDNLFRNRFRANLEVRVSDLIHRLLTPLTLERLLSHLDDLPDYAEAAPDTFLKLIEADLQEPEPAIHGLLKPADSGPFDRCLRTSLLWALEGLGWSHLGRVSAILAQLSSIPIEDNVANTPIGSLEGLYRFWLPRTTASLEERTQSLQTLTKRFPSVGWQVCMAQLSAGPQLAFPSHRPRWRDDSSGAGPKVTTEECHSFRSEAFELVLAWPNHDQTTLGHLVELLLELPDDHHDRIWDLIDDWADAQVDDGAKATLRERIRLSAFTRRSRRRGLKSETLDRAGAAYDRLEPPDPVARHSWLFAKHWIEPSASEIEEENRDYAWWAETIRALRISAIGEIWLERGFDGVTAVLADCGAPTAVGEALVNHISKSRDRVEFLRQCLSIAANLEASTDLCIRGFLTAIEEGPRATILSSVANDVAPERIARLFRCAPFCQHTWQLLHQCDSEVQDRYWQEVMPDWNSYSETELFQLMDRFLDARRPRAAFFIAHLDWSRIDTLQLKRLLVDFGTVGGESADDYLPMSYDISEAMHELDGRDGVDREEMVRLEFMYIQLLDHSKHGIPNLERWVSKAPIGFVQILALLFRRDDGGQDPPEWSRGDADNRAALASAAYRLLGRIARIPGTADSGEIDAKKLSRWIAEARRLCTEHGRAKIGDQYIGQILARGPADDDGIRPCIAISEVIESIGSRDVALGFIVGSHNARGGFMRSIGEGGKQERALAEKYRDWARQRSSSYPHVGSILEDIAVDYDRQALREDDEAEIERRLGQ